MPPARRAVPTVQMNLRVPPDLYDEIRALAEARQQTITDTVVEFLSAAVERERAKKAKARGGEA